MRNVGKGLIYKKLFIYRRIKVEIFIRYLSVWWKIDEYSNINVEDIFGADIEFWVNKV